MKTIKDEATLRKYIPNAIATVKGETPLFDKLAPFLQNTELWV
jgi:hypothetical protein